MNISNEQFALVCFLSIMQGNEGLIGKHPDYIEEKKVMLKVGVDAYSFLDRPNQEKVLAWLEEWKVELPNEIERYEEELANLLKE